jgi:hypothetical protein
MVPVVRAGDVERIAPQCWFESEPVEIDSPAAA